MASIATLAALGTRETVEEIPEHLLLVPPEGASPVQFRTIVISKRIAHAVPSPGAAPGLLEITVSKNPGTAEITVKDFVEGLGIAWDVWKGLTGGSKGDNGGVRARESQHIERGCRNRHSC